MNASSWMKRRAHASARLARKQAARATLARRAVRGRVIVAVPLTAPEPGRRATRDAFDPLRDPPATGAGAAAAACSLHAVREPPAVREPGHRRAAGGVRAAF